MKTFQIKVKPNACVSELTAVDDDTWLAKIKSPPIDGKAKAELVALVARHFDRRKSQVSIRNGASGRTKLMQIDRATSRPPPPWTTSRVSGAA